MNVAQHKCTSCSHKLNILSFLENFGILTLKFTVIVWIHSDRMNAQGITLGVMPRSPQRLLSNTQWSHERPGHNTGRYAPTPPPPPPRVLKRWRYSGCIYTEHTTCTSSLMRAQRVNGETRRCLQRVGVHVHLQWPTPTPAARYYDPLADPAARFWGGGKSFGGSNLTYPHFQLSPRISATLFSKHRILTIFYFMFNFYINFCQIPQALRAELADLAEGPSLAIKRPSLTNRRLLKAIVHLWKDVINFHITYSFLSCFQKR